MFKKHLLLLLLLALVVPWAANAQETFTVYENDQNTNSFVPLYSLYADYGTRSQFIIPATELEEMSGGTIQTLAFYATGYNAANVEYDQEYTLYMMEVNYTTFSEAAFVDWGSMTAVYVDSPSTDSDGKMTIELESPYSYGGGNLLIGLQVTEYGSTCPSLSWYGKNQASGSYTATYQYAGSSHNWSTGSYGVQRINFIPRTTFTYTAGASTATAPGVTTTDATINLTNTSVTLGGTITDMGGATGVFAGICYSTTATPTTSDSHVQSRYTATGNFSQNITGLLPGTTYYYRAYAYNSANSLADPTYGDIYSFTTAGSITLNQPANGEISVSVDGGTPTTSNTYALPGESVTLTATPASGYDLDCWTVTGVTGTASGNTYTFTMPSNSVTATANIVPTSGGTGTTIDWNLWERATSISTSETYLIGAISGSDVYLVLNYSPNTTNHYYYSSNNSYWGYTAKATLDATGRVTGCTGNATNLQYAQWKFSAETGGTITSQFESGRYLYGTTSSSWTDLYPASSTTTWTYSDDQLSYNSSSNYLYLNSSNYVQKGTATTASTVYIYKPATVTSYAITATASPAEGGTVAGSDYYANGATCTLTATPAFGYDFVSWTEGGVVVSTDAEYTFTVSSARTLVAIFESQGSCIKPTDLAQVGTQAAHQAQIGWTENNEATQWQVVYSTDSEFNPDDATPVTVNENPATIPGLSQATTYYARVRAICGQNSQSGWSNQGTFSTISGHLAPTVSYDPTTLTAHEVTVTWTGVATNVLHQSYDLYYSTNSVIPETPSGTSLIEGLTGNSHPLTGLTGDTQYYVWVRDNCGDDGHSDWSTHETFTTEISCPAPTGLDVAETSITARSATATWTGTSESYVVEYRESPIMIDEDFEAYSSGLPTDWTKVGTTGSIVVQGSQVHSGSKSLKFSGSTSNVVALPEFATATNQLKISFWTKAESTSSWCGNFEVGYITDVNDASTFVRVGEQLNYSNYGSSYQLVPNVSMASAPAGARIAFRHLSSSTSYYWFVDDIVVEKITAAPWVEAGTTTEQSYTFENTLSPNTPYQVKVKGYCGTDDGYSTEVGPVSFTTLVSCTEPTGLEIAEGYPTAHDVSFTWDYEDGEVFDICLHNGIVTDPTQVLWNGGTWEAGDDFPVWNTLTAESDYTFWLRKVCSATDLSEPVYVTFSTGIACPAPTGLEVAETSITASSATATWTGTSDSYVVMIGIEEMEQGTVDFEDQVIPAYFTNDATRPWTVTNADANDGTYSIKSGNWHVANSTSAIQVTVTYETAGTISFAARCSSEQTSQSSDWDYGTFYIDGEQQGNKIINSTTFTTYTYDVAAGTHTFMWRYKKDGSTDTNDDCLYVDDITMPVPVVNSWEEYTTTEQTYTFENESALTPNTPYQVKVKGDCGNDGYSTEIGPVSFRTLEACPTPSIVSITDIEHYSAKVTWTGNSDSYTVKYRTAGHHVFIDADFDGGVMPTGWTIEGANQGSSTTWRVKKGDDTESTGTHSGEYNVAITHNVSNQVTYLVTSTMDLSGKSDLNLALYYINRSYSGDIDGFGIYYRIDGGEWNEIFATTTAHSTWTAYDEPLPAGAYAANCQIGFKFTDHYGHGVGIDDITLGEVVGVGSWDEVLASVSPAPINSLTAGTKYEVVVVPSCGEESTSLPAFFTTVSANEKWFLTEGNWDVAANWEPTGAPTIEQNVTLFANATIPNDCVAEAKSISGTGTASGSYTLTIADGGQLKHNNSGVRATVKKNITGYGAANANTNNGYYFISNPLQANIYEPTSIYTPNITSTGLLTGTYDLYEWQSTQALEWRNYEDSPFQLTYANFRGYLYANQNDVELTFTGPLYASNVIVSRYPSYDLSYDLGTWTLIGNPFVCDAYLVDAETNGTALPYYKMNEAGNGYTAVADGAAIPPITGVFYQAQQSGTTIYMTREAPASNNNQLSMNLFCRNEQLDNAIIRFDGGQQLGKFSFREGSSKVYMPVEGKDLAIATAESNVGAMPVNFKAETNGSYTLGFNTEEVSFSYLHLIDNMTGADVDLLATPSYSFEARTTDYASRFKLVFATGNNADGNFAFFSNGSFIINNEGNATLQVIDVTGRVIKSESINGCANVSVNAATGVYMLRLINGNDVKVQKVIVR